MTDPFDVLRAPTEPVAPDPAFAAALRARIERALLHRGEERVVTSTVSTPSTSTDPSAARLHALTPYLAVVDARAAVEFYVTAFGARRRGEPIMMPDGRTGHVEVLLGDSVLMMADEFPEMGLVAPVNRGGVSQSLYLEVADPDAVVDRAIATGGVLTRPVTDTPYGRGGVVDDPSGHRWMISRETPRARPGDVVYASLWRSDVARAADFYRDVLGWRTTAGSGAQGRQVTELNSDLGLWGGADRPITMLCYAVPDVDAAVALVRAAGGTAGEPSETPHGRLADCVDDQGLPFALCSGGTPLNPTEPGGLNYVELRVPDTTAARAFYGTVLGWRFLPGADSDYWHMTVAGEPTRPWLGLAGGYADAAAVPTFVVPDLGAAVDAVRASGGRAGDPTPGRVGFGVDATDDQGAPFTLRLQH